MKKTLLLTFSIFITLNSFAIFTNQIEHLNSTLPIIQNNFSENIIYFAFTFALSFLGSYIIYGILVGPAALLGIYILTNNKQKRTYAWIGLIIGTLLGITLKILALS